MQKIICWNTNSNSGPKEIETKLNDLLKEGYRIIDVLPTEYYGSNYSTITKALIIIEEGRKEKLEKLNSLI